MARDVQDILIDICAKEGKLEKNQAVDYVKDLLQKARYVQDVWS
jgi:sulfite reductase alpha subunit-like flavoprotein